jgi:putative RNA 2'-phosphotransferase
MTNDQRVKTSKFLSYVLRHRPDEIGVELDRAGWVDVDLLLVRAGEHGHQISYEELEEVVATNDKQRFEFSEDRAMIRARQGHSVQVELGYEPAVPPESLYHGTAERNLEAIRREGLKRGRRHHVHLSENPKTAISVGQRYGKPVLLSIAAGKMHAAGHVFYRTGNGVWLTDAVPADYVAGGEHG